jgi:hypothetical protein
LKRNVRWWQSLRLVSSKSSQTCDVHVEPTPKKKKKKVMLTRMMIDDYIYNIHKKNAWSFFSIYIYIFFFYLGWILFSKKIENKTETYFFHQVFKK